MVPSSRGAVDARGGAYRYPSLSSSSKFPVPTRLCPPVRPLTGSLGAAENANGYPQAARCRPKSLEVWEYLQVTPRFLTLADVAETLNISASQTYALVRSGDLPAIKVGGRGQWRVESTALEEYISQLYDQTRTFVQAHPFGSSDDS